MKNRNLHTLIFRFRRAYLSAPNIDISVFCVDLFWLERCANGRFSRKMLPLRNVLTVAAAEEDSGEEAVDEEVLPQVTTKSTEST